MTSEKNTNKSKRNKTTSSKKIKTILKYTLIVVTLGFFLGSGATMGYIAALVKDDPVRSVDDIKSKVFKNDLTGFAYFSNKDGNGEYQLIGMLRADEDRRFIQFNDIPKYVYNAFLAVEDRDFESHYGVNVTSLTRAVIQQVLHTDVQTGGSTITQQLAKYTFFSFEKSFERKAKEIFLALRMERILSKDEIFTAYVNKIYFGKAANLNNVYGIQAAARGYFNKDAKDLNLAESAFLAGIPQRPDDYSSFTSEGFNEKKYMAAKKRQELVLSRMLEEEFITEAEYNEALTYDIKEAFDYTQVQKKAYNKYPYLMLEIENRAAEKLLEATEVDAEAEDYQTALANAKQELLTGGYRVFTTIDNSVYEALNEVAKNSENFREPINYSFKLDDGSFLKLDNQIEEVGATLVNNKTGEILGFVGGRDFAISQVNHSNFRGMSNRQPGSSIKPILDYGPAVELGKIQPGMPIDDIPLGDKWEPENWNHKYNGRIPARVALNWSYNIPAVKMYKEVGPEAAYEFYTKLGFEADRKFFLQAGNTPAIGSLGTSPEEMTRAFTTFPNGGTYIGAYMIDRIEDRDGNIVFEHKSEPNIVFSEQTAYILTDMMRTVITNGTGGTVRKYVKGVDIAGKTGTTNDTKDLWFVGYTPDVSLGVWVGYDYPYPIQDGALASKIWGEMLQNVLEKNSTLSPKDSKFSFPDGLVKMEVSSTSGKLPSDLTREAGYLVTDWFNKKYIPTEIDDSLERAKVVYYNGKRYLAKEETPNDMVQSGIFFKREPYELPFDTDRNGRIKVGSNGNKIRKAPPVDYDKELPTEVDPRVAEDGLPVPPTNFIFKPMGYKNVISFDKNLNENIVGYRLYRASTTSFGFNRISSIIQKDLSSERMYFEDAVDSNSPYVYYVTSVDVAGKESSPSKLIGNAEIAPFDPGELDNNADPDNPTGDNPTDDTTDNGDTSDNPTDEDQNDAVNVNPTAPENLSGKASGLTVILNWDANPKKEKITKYNIYYSRKSDGDFKNIGSSEENQFSYTLAIIGDANYYVTAVNDKGESSPSKVIQLINR